MFIGDNKINMYDRYGQQQYKGRFLLLMTILDSDGDIVKVVGSDGVERFDIRGVVIDNIKLSQSGHFMNGSWFCKSGERVFIEGSYGNNGLTRDVKNVNTFGLGVPLPNFLYDAWAKGGGWNGVGSEGDQMLAWARDIKVIQKQSSKCRAEYKECKKRLEGRLGADFEVVDKV